MPWHPICPGLRHYRGEEPADDPAKQMESADQWPVENGRLFWCGPIVQHFGHQIGEFGGRVLLSSMDPKPGHLLFLHPDGDRDFRELSEWQQAWIKYMNPNKKPVTIRGGKFRASRLVVVPQQQRLGCAPSPRQLLALGRSSCSKLANKVVVLSRSRYASARDEETLRGSIAGEAALDEYMRRRGAEVIYPETITLDEQIDILTKTKHLVVAEGSALHALELLGRQPEKVVTVIARRPLWKGMERPMRYRFPKLVWIDAVEELHWLPPGNERVKGLAKIDWEKLIKELNKQHGWIASTQEIDQLRKASNMQIEKLHNALPMRTRICTEDDRTAIRAGGW